MNLLADPEEDFQVRTGDQESLAQMQSTDPHYNSVQKAWNHHFRSHAEGVWSKHSEAC